ncbi:hypothetical protein ASPZODRAFT_136821 [Penicilliopsis zonata CBS 506.65]|uniref:Uncharacterized protein n=1 Tax=Penicilliopsis zonata CBS 506.65 TaxID=1073090 RepID=A0A1L9S720_9EURO|nr:hypothetical protein ASPZODRAFT_136821 [Penicilliopsis zonata CBS 506.65]OJJ42954.1 hypothetical protein ASPZODRAFT_136821 [Penicilliopsis zonata CBS 506.65]
MLAVRDQENLVHAHQTNAAAKPLNQGLKQLQPKTPGARAPKTPFKVPLNDENNPLAFGKKTVKAAGNRNENTKLGKDAFVTPFAGGQSRAPLGMKTTNAKTRGLQTPGPWKGTVKPEKTNKRSSTAQRVKKAAPIIQQNQISTQDKVVENDVPDIEYMPPKPKELPDFPDEINYDTSFPQFLPRNLALGLEKTYAGSRSLTKGERKLREDSAAYDKMVDEMIMKSLETINFEESDFPDQVEGEVVKEEMAKEATKSRRGAKAANIKPTVTSKVSTVKLRDAATALSGVKPISSTTSSRPPSSGHTSRPASRPGSSLLASRRIRTPTPTNPSSMRHSAATASSKTTVGYAKGRTMSSKLHSSFGDANKQPTTRTAISPRMYMQLYGPPALGSDMWRRCKAAGCFEDENRELEAEVAALHTLEDEETENFQLTL